MIHVYLIPFIDFHHYITDGIIWKPATKSPKLLFVKKVVFTYSEIQSQDDGLEDSL
ncbi:hypothetical protein [Leptospira harrisiae]|uniref:hypothetical protein n=1 Tax=Leptospira harrisiae TaxID=2023189 RepID=UPI0013FE4BCC|nr:hypothetical protein [Leptospira harrisiae]